MPWFRQLQHLLPDAAAWRVVIDKTLRRFLEGLTGAPARAKAFVDLVYLDLFPATTRALDEWEDQFGIEPAPTENARRQVLDAYWKAQGGQSPRYLQDFVQAAGFDIWVHEWWWPPNAAPRTARDPRLYTQKPRIGTVRCGEPFSTCGGRYPHMNDWLVNDPGYIVNLDLTPRAPPPIPDDPTKFPYFLYWGGQQFGTRAQIPASRRHELHRLLLKVCPTQHWLVLFANYFDDELGPIDPDDPWFYFNGGAGWNVGLWVPASVPPYTPTGPSAPAPAPPTGGGNVARPNASTGTGAFVVGRELYDGNGAPFRMRGTNKTHWDFQAPGLNQTKANTTRWIIDFTRTPDANIATMQDPQTGGTTPAGKLQIAGNWAGTCESADSFLESIVDTWVAQIPTWQTFERYLILNIANEWGDPNDHPAWRDANITAIQRIRNAGWNGAIMVDAPGCGQDPQAVIDHGAAVLAADPQKNVIFDVHVYGNYYDSGSGIPQDWQPYDLEPTLSALAETGLCVVIGEFGPGRNIGASPTLITPQRIVALCEQYELGWLSWSWDDNNLPNAMSDNNSFSHTIDGSYENLTDYGAIMVELWEQYAEPATIF